jgi:general nucleoside transport system permease protein
MQTWQETWLISAGALAVSAMLLAVFFASAGHNPAEVFYSLYLGAFGSGFSWENTLVRAAPLMLTAFCTLMPARVGLIVIGGEGAFVVGGLAAILAGLCVPEASAWWCLTLMFIAACIAGGLWIMAVGALQHFRRVNETISSLLLNYIAIAILQFLVVGILKDPSTLNNPSTYAIGESQMLGAIGESSVHWGLLYGLVACVALYILCRFTTWGFTADVVAGNGKAARLVGLPLAKTVLLACFIGGAAAGVAGMLEVAAVQGRANSALAAGYGYAGILVAFLARQNPLAVIPYAILLGGIQASGGLLQRNHDLPDATTQVIQGIIFMVILASEIVYGKRWNVLTRKQN